ncbi:MAG: YbhB/YbcL family Raf kinase inhibitor-like protein [Xanthobacteraceae bacterium]|nr:YbhB/YbcL family Raf kinase inhibitor-like protein [Xanthobacteraceae bacterium]
MQRKLMQIALIGIWLTGSCLAPAAAQDFVITSSAFQDGGWLAQKNAGNNPNNPNCVGENISPPLAWQNVPAKATSLALLMFDPEGRGGQGVSHWVAYGIPVSVTGFAEGEASKPSDKFVGGISTMKQSVYFGPCTPPGPLHHYTFTLIATTHGAKDLPPGLTREEFFQKSEGKLLTATGLIGLWKKK